MSSAAKRSNPDEADGDLPRKIPRRARPTPVDRLDTARHTEASLASSGGRRLKLAEKLLKAANKVNLYKYADITDDQVRLLVLHRGNTNDRIEITLRTISFNELGDRYQYEALSYHWGEGTFGDPIYIREYDPNSDLQQPSKKIKSMVDTVESLRWKRIYVKPNLYQALTLLRLSDEPVVLWVDALCINQGKLEEKKVQVARMAQIYNKAQNVCIWLGECTESTNTAMDFIKSILDLRLLEKVTKDESCTSKWRDVVALMGKSWFSRRWVIQELALARSATVHCGYKVVHWNDFKDAISLFVSNFDKVRKLFKRSEEFENDFYAIGDLDSLGAKVLVETTGNIFRKEAGGKVFEPIAGLETLVSTLPTFDTSDPRDTIHALRNLAKETPLRRSGRKSSTILEPPGPDYNKDLLDVYTDFLRWAVKTSDSIDIICRHWALPERTEAPVNYPPRVELPSWIQTIVEGPFSKQSDISWGRQNGDSFVGVPGKRPYNASYSKKPEVTFKVDRSLPPRTPATSTSSEQPTTTTRVPQGTSEITASNDSKRRDCSMYVDGLHIGTLEWASDPIPDGVIPSACLQKAGWTEDRDNTMAPDKVWRTLVADRGADGHNPPGWYHRACLNCLVNDTPNGHINTKELIAKHPHDLVRDFLKRVQAVTWNRVFLEAKPPGLEESEEERWVKEEAEGVGEVGEVESDQTEEEIQGLSPGSSQSTDEELLFGLGPWKAKEGDYVCILFGCSVPCILRPKEDEDGRFFEFIGEAFIYGKMDGEAITALTDQGLRRKTKTFKLR